MTKGHDKGHKGHKSQMSDREVMKLALEALKTADKKIIAGGIESDALLQMKNAITAIRQALDHVPDTTKMTEPDMGIDRGAWDDVPDATKWVDELRGGDETEREWVGLTDEEIAEGASQSWVDKQAFGSAVWWAEQNLREKNGF